MKVKTELKLIDNIELRLEYDSEKNNFTASLWANYAWFFTGTCDFIMHDTDMITCESNDYSQYYVFRLIDDSQIPLLYDFFKGIDRAKGCYIPDENP